MKSCAKCWNHEPEKSPHVVLPQNKKAIFLCKNGHTSMNSAIVVILNCVSLVLLRTHFSCVFISQKSVICDMSSVSATDPRIYMLAAFVIIVGIVVISNLAEQLAEDQNCPQECIRATENTSNNVFLMLPFFIPTGLSILAAIAALVWFARRS